MGKGVWDCWEEIWELKGKVGCEGGRRGECGTDKDAANDNCNPLIFLISKLTPIMEPD